MNRLRHLPQAIHSKRLAINWLKMHHGLFPDDFNAVVEADLDDRGGLAG